MIKKYIGHNPEFGMFVLRIVVGLVFLVHGYSKFSAGSDTVAGMFATIGIPAAMLMAWIVILIEFFGGLALILGAGTRLAALLLGIIMVVAIFTVKFKMGFAGGYEFDLVLLGALVALLLGGPGKNALCERE